MARNVMTEVRRAEFTRLVPPSNIGSQTQVHPQGIQT